MKLGFYYHTPLAKKAGKLYLPGYLAVFVNALAREVNDLYLFMHEAAGREVNAADYCLEGANIHWVSLGKKTPAWDRFLWPAKILGVIKNDIAKCDVLLVRAPSPLAPVFYNSFHQITNICYLIVGDYVKGAKYLHQNWWRKIPIGILCKRNDRQLTKVLAQTLTLVNSNELYRKYESRVKRLFVVKTTSLSERDLYRREDTCQGDTINLLYAGRLDLAKGLRELVSAAVALNRQGLSTQVHFVGWENDSKKKVEKSLKGQAEGLSFSRNLHFHGYKKTGEELNRMYRMADIYILPSYHEGFPRTIWEAMANSVPVIATKVGGIAEFLQNEEHALLVEPRRVDALTAGIRRVITERDLRKKLIRQGFELAKENTLEKQTKKMVKILSEYAHK